MGGPTESKKARDTQKYGEGVREQYGEGYANRPENTTDGAQDANDHGWAGGDDADGKASTDQPPGDEANKPKRKR